MIKVNQQKVIEIERNRLKTLTKRQFALYLDNIKATNDPEDEITLYDLVIEQINQDKKMRIEYEAVSEIERMSPTVAAISAVMGWSAEQVDEMWKEALNIN